MAIRQNRRMRQPMANDLAPLFDPGVHLDADGKPIPLTLPNGDIDERGPMVYVEMFCACGIGAWRQRDPVAYVLPQIITFRERHAGPGCGEASKANFTAARERFREAAHVVAAGKLGRYAPRQFPRLADEDDSPRPWPVLPEVG